MFKKLTKNFGIHFEHYFGYNGKGCFTISSPYIAFDSFGHHSYCFAINLFVVSIFFYYSKTGLDW